MAAPSEKESLNLEQVRTVIQRQKDDRGLALLQLYVGHGLRREEACRLNCGDIEDGRMYVTGKVRDEYMPLLPETKKLLDKFMAGKGPEEAVFTSRIKKSQNLNFCIFRSYIH